jgi:hypothetical protein
LKKSLLRTSAIFLFAFLVLIRVADLTISSTLARYSQTIQIFLQKTTGFEVYFGKLDFAVFGGLRFRDLIIRKDGQEIAFVRELRLSISPSALLMGRPGINNIILKDGWTTTAVARYQDYLITKLKNLAVSGKGPRDGMSAAFYSPKISVERFKIYLGSPVVNQGWVSVNSRIRLQRENLICKTSLDFEDSNFNRSFLREILFYRFSHRVDAYLQLAFMEDDLLVNNIVFSSDNLKINGAGIIYRFRTAPLVDIKFISIPLNLREVVKLKSRVAINGLLNIAANLKGGFEGLRLQTEMMMARSEFYFPRTAIRLSSIFCSVQFNNQEIVIQELSGLINYRLPVSLSGKISNWENPQFQFRVESFKTRNNENRQVQSGSFVSNISARLDNGDIYGDADLSLLQEKRFPYLTDKREIKVGIKDLRFSLAREQFRQASKGYGFKLTADELSVLNRNWVNENLMHSAELKLYNLSSQFRFNREDLLVSEMHGWAYEGEVEARGRWDLVSTNPNNFFLIRFLDLSVSDLKNIFLTPAQIAGRLSGILYFKNAEDVFMGGAIAISDATISNLALIDNIADFLGLKSIKELKKVFLVADFTLGRNGVKVKRFNLSNSSLNLSSSFLINDKEWVVGTVHLSLPKEVLEESSILRRLISMVREKNQNIDFDFKVSGFTNALRAELLEGEFRNRLISGLSSGIRGMIEIEIDKAMSYFRQQEALKQN